MKKVVIGYAINDEKVFNTSVLGEALKQMTSAEGDAPYYTYAVSRNDEFQRVEDIEDIIDDCDGKYGSDSEKLEAIREVLKRG